MSHIARKVLGVAEVRVPPMAGDEAYRRWRGALYADGGFEFWSGEDFADLADLDTGWTCEPAPPEQVRLALEFLCCWRSLPERDSCPVLRMEAPLPLPGVEVS